MALIDAHSLSKSYRTTIKAPGLLGAFRSLIKPEYKHVDAVQNVSFIMKEGASLALIGENGAGKSTLIKMLVGILTPTQGHVSINGHIPQRHEESFLCKIGVIFGQKTNLWWDIPVIESYRAIKTLYKLPNAEYQAMYEEVVEALDLTSIIHSPARKLSLGQRMRADVGMVFLHKPSLLFLDEPTIGLDVNVKHTIRSFIRMMNKEHGMGVLLTSHDLDDIEEICEDTIILSGGKSIYQGKINTLKNSYVKEKVVRVTGEQHVKIEQFLPGASVVQDGRIATITYDHHSIPSSTLLETLNRCYSIEDIVIQEPSIESIVSRIYTDASVEEGI